VAEHSITLGHRIKLHDTTVLSTKSTNTDQMIWEAIEIDLRRNNMNRKTSFVSAGHGNRSSTLSGDAGSTVYSFTSPPSATTQRLSFPANLGPYQVVPVLPAPCHPLTPLSTTLRDLPPRPTTHTDSALHPANPERLLQGPIPLSPLSLMPHFLNSLLCRPPPSPPGSMALASH
jgi:hypothetical protein